MGRRGTVAAVVAGMMCLAAPPAEAAPALAKPYDFDGNGYVDLVIGAPALRAGNVLEAGGVVVLPSSEKGPSRREQVITASGLGVPGGSEEYTWFGYAVASADFNRDGYADLAVGQPNDTVNGDTSEGSVTVVYGSRTGLDMTRSATITQPDGRFGELGWGSSLATLDSNGDGFPDLAVGAPGDEYGAADGKVGILPGGQGGVSRTPVSVLSGGPTTDPATGVSGDDSRFGSALATGDLDRDGDTDLVVVSGGTDNAEDEVPGSVSACLTQSGRQPACRRLLHKASLQGLASVAVGNMSGDALPEIVIGVPGSEESNPIVGSVRVLHLSKRGGLHLAKLTKITQNSRGVPGKDERKDWFGTSLALGDIDRTGYADLVVGAPGENKGRGQVTVIRGARSGWKTSGNYSYSQNTNGIPGKAERGDGFGWSLTLLDHNRDGRLDLSIGAPFENKLSGAITTLPGSGKKFSTGRSHTFGLKKLGYRYPAQARFGLSLGR